MLNCKRLKRMILINYFLFVLGVLLSLLGLTDCTIVINIIASILLLQVVKNITNSYINFSMFFTFFHVLYGLSGVISKAWFNQLSSTYGTVFRYCPYLLAFSLCSLFLLSGMLVAYKKNYKSSGANNALNVKYKNYFMFVSYVGFALTTIFELVNFFRVGGVPTLLAGKAIYQARVDELFLTLPTQQIFQVSLAAFCVYLYIIYGNNLKITLKQIMIPIFLALPYMLIIIILGRRGPLLVVFLLLVITYFMIKPLKKISFKIVGVTFIVYVFLGIVFAVRNDIKLLFTDFQGFTEKVNVNYILKNLNPALNEFGCTYGNFNKFYVVNDYQLLYGKSYIYGLSHIVPTYIYSGDKPRLITYEFRDKYFPDKSKISSIASTGFSSILETYWNFWYFGAVIYFIYGYLIITLENKIKFKSCFSLLYYLSLTTTTYSFHRSDFGHFSSEIIFLLLEVLCIRYFYHMVYSKVKSIDTFIEKI